MNFHAISQFNDTVPKLRSCSFHNLAKLHGKLETKAVTKKEGPKFFKPLLFCDGFKKALLNISNRERTLKVHKIVSLVFSISFDCLERKPRKRK